MNKVGKFMKALAHLNFMPRALQGVASIGGKRDERLAGSVRAATPTPKVSKFASGVSERLGTLTTTYDTA